MINPAAALRQIDLLFALVWRLAAALWPRDWRGPPPAPVWRAFERCEAALAGAIRDSLAQFGDPCPDLPDRELIAWFRIVHGRPSSAAACVMRRRTQFRTASLQACPARSGPEGARSKSAAAAWGPLRGAARALSSTKKARAPPGPLPAKAHRQTIHRLGARQARPRALGQGVPGAASAMTKPWPGWSSAASPHSVITFKQ